MSRIKRRPPCPECGGVRQLTLSAGWANEGNQPYTYVRCEDCDYHGICMSVWLPPEASASALDEDRRTWARRHARLKRGRYAQLKPLIRHRDRRITSDRVEITIRIIPGKLESGLAKRIDSIRGNRRRPVVREVSA